MWLCTSMSEYFDMGVKMLLFFRNVVEYVLGGDILFFCECSVVWNVGIHVWRYLWW